jgi:RNA 3'-terminal phosphate cyclase-like protein
LKNKKRKVLGEEEEEEESMVMVKEQQEVVKLAGAQHFRQRLLLATLAGKTLRIDEIRARDSVPGLRDYEVSFLRLLEKISNGCIVEINETGMTVYFFEICVFFENLVLSA